MWYVDEVKTLLILKNWVNLCSDATHFGFVLAT
jgi:hypothetical protein